MDHEAEVIGVGLGAERDVPVVILEADDQYLPIFVTADQARSIGMAIEGEPFERPLTHDLLADIVTEFGGAIDRVRIDDLADGTFYAKLDVERYDSGESERYVFDARPSDGVALAVRADCQILVSDEILSEAGRSADAIAFSEEFDDT